MPPGARRWRFSCSSGPTAEAETAGWLGAELQLRPRTSLAGPPLRYGPGTEQ